MITIENYYDILSQNWITAITHDDQVPELEYTGHVISAVCATNWLLHQYPDAVLISESRLFCREWEKAYYDHTAIKCWYDIPHITPVKGRCV